MSFEEIEDNLFRIEVPLPDNPLRYLNAWLLRADPAHPGWRGRSLLIDNGFNRPVCLEALEQALDTLGVAPDSLDFFITHLHADHCGLTSRLMERAGRDAWCFASAGDGPRINMFTRQSFRVHDSFEEMTASGMPHSLIEHMTTGHPGISWATDSPCPFTPAMGGDVFAYGRYSLKVLDMPGHTPDLLCLYDENKKILFSSDHILGDISPNISHWKGMRDALGSYLRSLKKASRLDVKLCLPGHRTLFADCRGRIQSLERHHQNRLDEVRNILDAQGPCAAYFVASRMTWSVRAKHWDSFPQAQQWFACGEALAHLEHLVQLGDVRREKRRGLKLYRLTHGRRSGPHVDALSPHRSY